MEERNACEQSPAIDARSGLKPFSSWTRQIVGESGAGAEDCGNDSGKYLSRKTYAWQVTPPVTHLAVKAISLTDEPCRHGTNENTEW